MSKKPAKLLSPQQQEKWLVDHIPHRIRATLYGIPMHPPWDLPPIHVAPNERLSLRCIANGAWEGRMTALRWLIMFVGIKQDGSGCACEAALGPASDMRIDGILGGVLFPPSHPDADKLAKVWRGCSQATSHATEGSNHPPVTEPYLAEALHVVIAHLESTIYASNGRSLLKEALGRQEERILCT